MASPFASGLKFQPTNEELVCNYLYNKVHRLPYFQEFIKDFDLYGEHEPWVVFEMFGGIVGEDLYFFTKLKKKHDRHLRICRRVGSNGGTWSGESSDTILSSTTNNPIGYYKRFRYENGGLEHHGEWIMHEYSLHTSYLPNNSSGELVLCRIRKNDRPTQKALKRGLRDESEVAIPPPQRRRTESEAVNSPIVNTVPLMSNMQETKSECLSDIDENLMLDFSFLFEPEEDLIHSQDMKIQESSAENNRSHKSATDDYSDWTCDLVEELLKTTDNYCDWTCDLIDELLKDH